jgi:hypothetical protein
MEPIGIAGAAAAVSELLSGSVKSVKTAKAIYKSFKHALAEL